MSTTTHHPAAGGMGSRGSSGPGAGSDPV